MKIVIIDYGAGNIKSIQFAIKRLGFESELSKEIEIIRNADRVIFPGVGEAGSAMEKLRATGLHKLIPELKQPVLGICLGMQLLCNSSEEGNTEGLGIFDCDAIRFSNKLKVPQIGWNQVGKLESELFSNIEENENFYAVHSYYVPLCKETIAMTEYGIKYASALQKDNFYGVQFHPEKSGPVGEKLLHNFIKL